MSYFEVKYLTNQIVEISKCVSNVFISLCILKLIIIALYTYICTYIQSCIYAYSSVENVFPVT